MKGKRRPATRTFVINTYMDAVVKAVNLVTESRWFQFTPLPDGQYEFEVKNEY
jgi:hypothetical protein